MHPLATMNTAATHQLYGLLRRLAGRDHDRPGDGVDRDRGAVSLEQVLWFVAAGVSVTVIATLIWNSIRDEAQKDPIPPPAPTP